MADRVPLPVIPGLLSGFVGLDRRILTLSWAARLDSLLIGIRDPGATDVTVEIRRTDALAVQTSIATATITAGATSQQDALAVPVALLEDEILDARVTADGTDAMTLDGWIELLWLPEGFTTLARVKRSLGIVDTESDAVISELITSATQRMRRYMGRQITTTTGTLERYSHNGKLYELQLAEWPLQSVSAVQVDGVAVADFDTIDDLGQVLYGPAGSYSHWPQGYRHIEVTYTAGYTTAPEDIAQAATVQVAWDFKRRERTGERSSLLDEGNVVTYLVDAWAPEVTSVMDHYRRVEAV